MKCIFLFAIYNLALISLPAYSAIYKCRNEAGKVVFTDRPCESGRQIKNSESKAINSASATSNEVLVKDGKVEGIQASYIKYLDNLKVCKPYAFSDKNPILGKVENKIIGKNNGGCQVVMSSDISGELVCNYSNETISLMTSDGEYQKIKNEGIYSQSDSDTDIAIANRMSEECVTSR